uniref:Lipocalin/cytosolic fatty-acid binding domain-containing protein n=1 Tax=Equus caballus TaxID=9796 RepID=F6YP96_HORSE
MRRARTLLPALSPSKPHPPGRKAHLGQCTESRGPPRTCSVQGSFSAACAGPAEPRVSRRDFDKIIGTWYVKAVVADKDLPKEKRPKKVSPLTVTALDGGDLEAMVTFMKGGQCHEKRVVMHQTEEPGRYSTFGGKRHMHILDLPVKDHRIFYCEGQLGGKAIRIGKLVGRNPDMSLEALEEFKKFAERKGLPQENIIMPVQRESCIPESD